MTTPMEDLRKFTEVTRDCWLLLEGNDSEIQGAVLADLLASWLACLAPREPTRDAAREVREKALDRHLKSVWRRVEAKTIDEWPE